MREGNGVVLHEYYTGIELLCFGGKKDLSSIPVSNQFYTSIDLSKNAWYTLFQKLMNIVSKFSRKENTYEY